MGTPKEPHFHKCKECNDRVQHGCVDPTCDEGWQWVILCFRCYERMQAHLERMESGVDW